MKKRSTLSQSVDSATRFAIRPILSFARKHLQNMYRLNGIDYARHGEEVAGTLSEITHDPSMLAVAILHDLPVHKNGEQLLRLSPLTQDERNLVHRMHELRKLDIASKHQDLDRVILSMQDDPRLLPLRMAHRLNDIRALHSFEPGLRKDLANETLHMYTAIAGRIGMNIWRHEMEDTCFLCLQPNIACKLQKAFERYRELDERCLRHIAGYARKILEKAGIECMCESRIKSLYSTYRKMTIKRRRFEELTDRLALRIIVQDVEECYRTLGIIHGAFRPIPGKLKDYIGAPKDNGYRSIHTVVYPLKGVSDLPVEIQIRTHEMQTISAHGVAAHINYKQDLYALQTPASRAHLFRNLLSMRHEAHSSKEFSSMLRTYFDDGKIAVFTKNNQPYRLRNPASALDCIWLAFGARSRRLKDVHINGKRMPFGSLLHDGDIVEASFGRTLTISKEWLHLCHRALSKKEIRSYLQIDASKTDFARQTERQKGT